MIKIILTCLFTYFSSIVFAGPAERGSFSGRVMNAETGKPVVGASIYITNLKQGTTTNETGYFKFNQVSEGQQLIEVSHIGFNTIAQTILIQGDTYKDFSLTPSIVENTTVVVTGVSHATTLRKTPFQVTVIQKDELQKSSSLNIIDLISKKAGISALSTGPAISKPLIRGLGYNRLLTINDGVRQEGQQWGDEHGIEIDESSVSKVEILKGPASLMYGSDAIAGVLNIITNVPVQEGSMKLNAGAGYQTNNHSQSIHANWAGNNGVFNWNLYGSFAKASDYKNKYDGYVYNSKFIQNAAGGYAGINKSWGYSHLIFSTYYLQAGLIEAERDSAGFFIKPLPGGGSTRASEADFKSYDPQIPFQHIHHQKIALDNNFKLGQNRLALIVAAQQNKREEFGDIDNLQQRELYFKLRTFTYSTQLHLAVRNGWKPSLGISGMQQQNKNEGENQLIPDYRLSDLGGFGYIQKELKKLTLSAGIRYDHRSLHARAILDGNTIKNTAFNKQYGNISASMGGTYRASQYINLKANIARAYRTPSLPELASNGAHEGTNRYEYGDRNLKSETSLQSDVSIEYQTPHLFINLAGYYNHFDHFIFYKKLINTQGADSVLVVNGKALDAYQFTQSKANLSGLELTVDIHPHPLDWLHFENSFSMVNARFVTAIDGSRNIPNIPAARLVSSLRGNFKKVSSWLRNSYASIELENTWAQKHPFTGYHTETETPGYALLNLGLGTDIYNKKDNPIFSIYFSALNITDKAYQSHVSRLKYAPVNEATGRTGVFNTGRNFSFKIRVPLSFLLPAKKIV